MCVEPYCAVERGAWVHAVAGVGARTPVRASVQLTLCRSLLVVRATARPRHTDSDRVVRREVLERSHNERKTTAWVAVKSPRAGLPPAACEGGGTPFVCGVRCGMHAHRSLLTLTTRLVAHPHTRLLVSQFGTLTLSHPTTVT